MRKIIDTRRSRSIHASLVVLVLSTAFMATICVGSASATVIHNFEGLFNGSESPGGGAGTVLAAAVDDSSGPSAGDVYLAGVSSVVKLNPDGTYAGTEITGSGTPQGSFSLVSGSAFIGTVAVDGSAGPNSGDVYVTDPEHGVVDKFGETGTFICQITGKTPADLAEEEAECAGATGSATPDGSIEPTGIVVDPTTGDLWISDLAHEAIDEFNPAGQYVTQIKDPHIVTPGPLALGSSGKLYVTNRGSLFGGDAANNVVVFDGGSFEAVFDEHEPLSVAVDPTDGHVYIFQHSTGEVAEYEASGALIDTFVQKLGSGQSPIIESLSVSNDGHIYAGQFGEGVSKYGPDLTVPTPTTEAASEVGQTEATLNGQVDPDSAHGGGAVEHCDFEYVTQSEFEVHQFENPQSTSCVPATPFSGHQAVRAVATLAPSTGYVFRLSASNSNGVVANGAVLPLSTVGPPVIAGEESSTLGAAEATLSAVIDASGFAADCHVEYVDQTLYEESGYAEARTAACGPAAIPATATAERVSASIPGLSVGTDYHYRFVSTNSAGTTRGADETFATFGIESFSFEALDHGGDPYPQAAGHPYEWAVDFALNTTMTTINSNPATTADANVRDIITELPPGLLASGAAVPQCPRFLVALDQCPPPSQVGLLKVFDALGERFEVGIYNVAPPEGVPVELGAVVQNLVRVYIDGNVRTGGDYGATATVINASSDDNITASHLSIWGNPGDPGHDAERICPVPGVSVTPGEQSCRPSLPQVALLSNPTSCPGSPLLERLSMDSWQLPNQYVSAVAETPATTGCNRVGFDPGLEARPTTAVADSPSGLHVDIHVPQNSDPEGLAPADLRDATVTLPPGLVVNPSSANGLAACTASQIGLTSAPKAAPVTYTPAGPECPAASRLGTVEVDTPLLDHPLPGSVYLAQPFENPFDSLLAIYIVVDDPQSGVVVKLAGQVKPDPQTGQLTSVVEESPQLPFEDFKLDFFKGSAAPLRTPAVCGGYETSSVLTPWSAPESGPSATPADHYEVSAAAAGGSCPRSAAAEPDAPSFEAGTQAPTAGTYSPFVLHLARADGSQEIDSIDTTLPAGLIGKLAGVTECSDAELAAAGAHPGAAEQQSPSCPSSSELGTVQVGAGAGPQPYYATGHAYLAGPYKGAPLSLAIITPAVAGPFDLGTVVVRTALQVNPETTQITAVSDEIPHILRGIPLDVRSVTVDLKRPDFTLNPTNCEKKQITGSVGTVQGRNAPLSEAFQVGGCKSLGFAPKLKLSLEGSTKHAGHPALRAVLTYPKGGAYANIARAQVNLPHSEFIDQANLNKTCTKPILLAGDCPATSIYGRARAWTPLLDKPLEGPVYLVGGYGYKLPALVAELDGQIRVLLVGKVDSGKNHGIRNTFEAVPDAPVERFELSLKGGPRYSLLENSEDLCARPQRAIASFTAQSGSVLHTRPLVANGCGGHGKGKKARHGNHRGHKRSRGSARSQVGRLGVGR
jgi:hypothetical protein